MTTLDVLIKARKILSDPRRWVKGTARKVNAEGEYCYCALGALYAAAGCYDKNYFEAEAERALYLDAEELLNRHLPTPVEYGVPYFNDKHDTTYEDLMRVFSNAIQAEVGA